MHRTPLHLFFFLGVACVCRSHAAQRKGEYDKKVVKAASERTTRTILGHAVQGSADEKDAKKIVRRSTIEHGRDDHGQLAMGTFPGEGASETGAEDARDGRDMPGSSLAVANPMRSSLRRTAVLSRRNKKDKFMMRGYVQNLLNFEDQNRARGLNLKGLPGKSGDSARGHVSVALITPSTSDAPTGNPTTKNDTSTETSTAKEATNTWILVAIFGSIIFVFAALYVAYYFYRNRGDSSDPNALLDAIRGVNS